MNLLRHSIPLCLIAIVILPFAKVHSQTLNGDPFEFYGEEQPLVDVLTSIATHSRLGVEVNEEIDSNFSGYLMKRDSEEALNFLAGAFDLVWYFDGATIYVDPISSMDSKLFLLETINSELLKQTMKDLSIWDDRFEWRSLGVSGIAMISGPPRYLDLVDQTVEMLKLRAAAANNDTLAIQIYKLKYASAADRRVNVRDEEVVLPGVATLLKGLLSSGSISEHAQIFPDLDNTQAEGTQLDEILLPGAESKNRANTIDQLGYSSGASHPNAAVYPDPSTNSVIIQDYNSRLLLYENLIGQLDQQRQQLEISLVIIDLTTNSLREIGVNWNVDSVARGGGLLDLVLPGSTLVDADFFAQTNVDFLATVRALESEGKARVTSRPAVVTEDGMEALLDNNESFFVRVEGERVASLEQITYGTLLKVVPRIVDDSSELGEVSVINLDVQIEDANRLNDGGVDSIPSIRNTLINTRSSVPNGGSLLIGGYYREATTSNVEGVPMLGRIPIFGSFFRRDDDSQSQLVRLFMLSPRILSESLFESQLSHSDSHLKNQYIPGKFSDVSNYNPNIHELESVGFCEPAHKARQRRNNLMAANISTRILPCNEDTVDAYRVVTSN
ncbi:type III secretion system outer membrane ring subunit SctC [Microbulbifer sp. JMSA003]|uniref:type III secretion system outer membrane ring subunit SctC n=1 Tax=unclassified Microbulbifer TaxID=2619833 RepID=UPI00403A1450